MSLLYTAAAFTVVLLLVIRALRPKPVLTRATISGDRGYDLEVVGEANYLPTLRSIAGLGEVRHECIAELHLEDSNPYDNKAVKVMIDGQTVGYLSRKRAREYRKEIANKESFVGVCRAVVVGGGPGRENLGVWLDIPIET